MFFSGLLVLLLAAVVVAGVFGLRSLRAFVRALWPH
jgi:hypothetical protein